MKPSFKTTFQIFIFLLLTLIHYSIGLAQTDTYITADNSSIQYMGRIDFSNAKSPKLSYPGITIRAKFTGSEIKGVFNDLANGTSNYFNVIIDDILINKIQLQSQDTLYTLANNLTNGDHIIELVKRTESSVGTVIFKGFVIESTSLLSPADPLPTYKMEFIGDSWTCGYGNEISTNNPNTGFHSVNEDNYRAWGYTVAKKFNAQYHATAISGRGLYRNNTGTTYDVIPDEFNKVIPGQTLLWDFNNYIPDLVVIHLGTNDFYPETVSPTQMLDSTLFVNKYIELIDTLRSKYGSTTKIICAFGNSKSDWWPVGLQHLTRWRNYITATVDHFNKNGDNLIYKFELSVQNAPYGEDWHPTILTHNQMANEIAPFIESITGLEASLYEAPLNTPTSIIGPKKNKAIKLFPNPSQEKFTIEGINENQEWIIFDTKGYVHLKGVGTRVNIKNLKEGRYILQCGETQTSFIKY